MDEPYGHKVLEPLRVLHPDDGGWITFHTRKGENPFYRIAAKRPSDLGGLFPDVVADLAEDAYFSINGFYQPWCKSKLVANINAVWLDIDYHKEPDPQMAAEEGIASVMRLGVTGKIPEPTLYVRSGRGFWCFWRLRNVDGDALTTKDPAVRCTWERLMRGVIVSLRAYGYPVDAGSSTIERRTRMPESINSKAGSKVTYTVNYGAHGGPISYTLPELARWFNVSEVPLLQLPPPASTTVSTSQNDSSLVSIVPASSDSICVTSVNHLGRKSSGQRALCERRLRDLETLLELRGGRFHAGCRNNATMLYAALIRGSPDRTLLVSNFAKERCLPRLKEYEIKGALKAFNHRLFRITDRTIGDLLEITPAEAANLEGGMKYLTDREPYQAARPTKIRRSDRRELITALWDASPAGVTLSNLQSQLHDHGHDASLATIRNDLSEMGIVNPRRKRQAEEYPALPLDPSKTEFYPDSLS
jgi:hypothetical protein